MKQSKKLSRSITAALAVLFALSISAYAWFYFPMTQYTMVYTDGVIEAQVKAAVYNYNSGVFTDIIADESEKTFSIAYRSDEDPNEIIAPYFFLWGGEYTTNQKDKTIYKVDVSYDNEMGASPSKLRLYGDFAFESYCVGNEENINIRFMKLGYFIAINGNNGDFAYLDEGNYTFFDADEFSGGVTKDLGLLDLPTLGGGATPADFDYTLSVYFLVTTDEDALQTYTETLKDEDGILPAVFGADCTFYYRTEPANALPTTSAGEP